ncbi:hypothetical protein EES44_30405 [Streptomyces sp. ADI96-15]|nr:hypothetical protein EES44_30405 [Streptomyces sp. ADI96-15]
MVNVVVLHIDTTLSTPRGPEAVGYFLLDRDRPVPASLARHGEGCHRAHGHLVREGEELHGSALDHLPGTGGREDVRAHIWVQAGAAPHGRVVSRVAQCFSTRGRRLKRWQRRHNSTHANIRCFGEQAMATLKGWRLLRKLRCSTNRITDVVKAVLVLHHTTA